MPISTDNTVSIDSINPEIFVTEKLSDKKLPTQRTARQSKSSIKIGKNIRQQTTTP